MAEIQRRKTPTVKIGHVRVGWEVPVVVQSMTNTDTADIAGTIEQVAALALAGSEIVRVTVNNEEAAAAVPAIVEGLDKRGLKVPIVGDFHYNGHLLLKKFPATARALAKYRINPGNASIGKKDNDNFQVMVECAVENQKPVRIGVNWGSLDQALLTRMMDQNSSLPNPLPGPRSHDGSDGGQLRWNPLAPPSATDSAATRSFSPPRSPACATSSMSIPASPRVASTCSTSASPKPAWAQRDSSHPPPVLRRCCSPALATPSA